MYVPYGQIPNVEARPTIVLRTSIEPTNLTSSLRKAVSEVDATVPLDQIETMQQIVFGSVGQSRFRTAVLAMFALLALLWLHRSVWRNELFGEPAHTGVWHPHGSWS
jgi:hypothetical protein